MSLTTRLTARRAAIACAAVPVALAAMAGCSSDDEPDTPASSSTSSSSTPTSAATSGGGGDCTEESLLSALPGGATMVKYTCASAGDEQWAAAEVNPGHTVFFLKWNGSSWDAETSDDICGTASAGLPSELLDYCPS